MSLPSSASKPAPAPWTYESFDDLSTARQKDRLKQIKKIRKHWPDGEIVEHLPAQCWPAIVHRGNKIEKAREADREVSQALLDAQEWPSNLLHQLVHVAELSKDNQQEVADVMLGVVNARHAADVDGQSVMGLTGADCVAICELLNGKQSPITDDGGAVITPVSESQDGSVLSGRRGTIATSSVFTGSSPLAPTKTRQRGPARNPWFEFQSGSQSQSRIQSPMQAEGKEQSQTLASPQVKQIMSLARASYVDSWTQTAEERLPSISSLITETGPDTVTRDKTMNAEPKQSQRARQQETAGINEQVAQLESQLDYLKTRQKVFSTRARLLKLKRKRVVV